MSLLRTQQCVLGVVIALGLAGGAQAHFQELIPDTDIVTQATGRQLGIQLQFTHPMNGGPVMAMETPRQFGVLTVSGKQDLMSRLTANTDSAPQSFTANYAVKSPGDLVFYLEPAPYWEPAEGLMIVHYTKTVVPAFGGEENWQAEVGFPVEITPLTRPYGLWAGNLFTGIVKQEGEPVPFAEVEVEWRNDGSVGVPNDVYATQVVRADANGVFSYAMPRSGWWGFAALLEAPGSMTNPEGKQVPVEAGALIWVHTRKMD